MVHASSNSIRWFTAMALAVQFSICPASAQFQVEPEYFDQRNLPVVQQMLEEGDYRRVVELTEIAIQRGFKSPSWFQLRSEAFWAVGQADEATQTLDDGLELHKNHLPLLQAKFQVLKGHGKAAEAQETLKQMQSLARAMPLAERSPVDLIALGQAAIAAGADAQKVIQQFFEPARKKPGGTVDAALAIGELALQKEDFARAADEFRTGLKERPDSTALHFGLARAYQSSDRNKCQAELQRVLEINEGHVGALLLQAELLFGAEKFEEVDLHLQAAQAVNSHHPETLALVSAYEILVRNDEPAAKAVRERALAFWNKNPVVDHLIGRVLSRAYRFKEGAAHQRAALGLDPAYAPAKVQLCLDLFRLGEVEEAWKVAAEVRAADGYHAQAHNFGLLEQHMKHFDVVSDKDFILRLPKRDRAIYADRALELLREARLKLGEKYGLVFDKPVLVEFFPSQQDFAIRTFGNLGGQGILGACFGTVVTMNSPGSISARRSNWESTLWHEFCHVVTLTVTHNRMPRWLSEGISVYEEGLRDPASGMKMSLTWRRMILEQSALTPVGQLSSAFTNPKSGDHLLFAYFQTGQVVEFLIEKYGMKSFRAVLKSLAEGTRINEALATHLAPLEEIEAAFDARIREQATNFAAGTDFSQPDAEAMDPRNPEASLAYLKENPTNYAGQRMRALGLLRSERWDEALAAAQEFLKLCPEDTEPGNGYELAAAAARGARKDTEEAQYLREWAQRRGDAMPAFMRLLELETEAENWKGLEQAARWVLAINPFLKQPHEALTRALESQGREEPALVALKHLQILGPDNPAEVYLRLAKLLQKRDPAAAKTAVLDALAEAPRHREAMDLLQTLQKP